MRFSLSEITSSLECEFQIKGKSDNFAISFDSVFDARENSICWLRATDEAGIEQIKSSQANIVICSNMLEGRISIFDKSLVMVDKPQVAFMRMMKNLLGNQGDNTTRIHPTAIISPKATLGKGTTVGPFAVIGDCEIGQNCTIQSHSIIHDGTKLMNNIFISNHVNIGGVGFGYIHNENEDLENMLHTGMVYIDDDVSVFPYTNIDRSTLGCTKIGRGSKIDHFCHISHNSTVGEKTLITANVTLLGGSSVGNRCTIGSGSILKDGVRIGDDVMLGMSSVVTKDIPDGEIWVGNPARPITQFRNLQKKLKNIIDS